MTPIPSTRLPSLCRDLARLSGETRDLARTITPAEAADPEMLECIYLARVTLDLHLGMLIRSMSRAIEAERAAARLTEEVPS